MNSPNRSRANSESEWDKFQREQLNKLASPDISPYVSPFNTPYNSPFNTPNRSRSNSESESEWDKFQREQLNKPASPYDSPFVSPYTTPNRSRANSNSQSEDDWEKFQQEQLKQSSPKINDDEYYRNLYAQFGENEYEDYNEPERISVQYKPVRQPKTLSPKSVDKSEYRRPTTMTNTINGYPLALQNNPVVKNNEGVLVYAPKQNNNNNNYLNQEAVNIEIQQETANRHVNYDLDLNSLRNPFGKPKFKGTGRKPNKTLKKKTIKKKVKK
jgi:hypothetical protein